MYDGANFFERFPKITLMIIVLVISVVFIFAAEAILSDMEVNKGFNHGYQRYIRLKEYKPKFSHTSKPQIKNKILGLCKIA